jgi:RNA polymerase sigma-70 factor (ECF subfamily)
MPDDDLLDAWFKREVVVHEGALTRYLRRSWPNPDDIHDLRQEIYVRAYESARKQLPAAARPFIFAIARHLMTDRIRRQRIVPIDSVGDVDALNVLVDDLSPEHRTAAHQELRKLAQALDSLSVQCRTVVWMRRVDDLPQKEVAARLGLSQKTVEKHVMNAMKRLTDAVFGGRAAGDAQTRGAGEDSENERQQRD